MSLISQRLAEVRNNICIAAEKSNTAADEVKLITVSKTFEAEQIRPVLEAGQRVFGENRVQESRLKWPQLRAEFPDVELHLIGPLQSNKVKEAVSLFDVVHTVDREKIAKALAKEVYAQKKQTSFFVQVNTGMEPQKAGIAPNDSVDFVQRCRKELGLDIVGLMCIPPFDENPGPHFALLAGLAEEAGVSELSMGMSSDYELAIQFGATYVRVGSAIFGARDNPATEMP